MAKGTNRKPYSNEPRGTQNNKINHFVKDDVPPVPQMQNKTETDKKRPYPTEKTEG